MEHLVIQELAEKVNRVTHRLKNTGDAELLRIGRRTQRRIKRANDAGTARSIEEQFYTDLKKKLKTTVPFSVAPGLAQGISNAAPILSSDAYGDESAGDDTGIEESIIDPVETPSENSPGDIETTADTFNEQVVVAQQSSAANSADEETDEFNEPIEEPDGPREEIIMNSFTGEQPDYVVDADNMTGTPTDAVAAESFSQPVEQAPADNESTEPVSDDTGLTDLAEESLTGSSSEEQVSWPEELPVNLEQIASLPVGEPVEDIVDAEPVEGQVDDTVDAELAEEPQEELIDAEVFAETPVSEEGITASADAIERTEVFATTSGPATVAAQEPIDVGGDIPSPAVEEEQPTGQTEVGIESLEPGGESRQMPLLKSYLGLVANVDNYDKETAKTLLHEFELSKRASQGLDETMLNDLDKKIASITETIGNIQKPFIVEDQQNPDGRPMTVEQMGEEGSSVKNYIAPSLKMVKTLSDQIINIGAVFTGPVGAVIDDVYGAAQNVIGVNQAIDEGNLAKGASGALGLVSKVSDNLSIVSSVGKNIEAYDAMQQGKTTEAHLKGLEAVGDGISKVVKDDKLSKGIGAATAIPAAVNDLIGSVDETKEVSAHNEQIEKQAENAAALQDDKVLHLIRQREELLDLKHRHQFANMEQTDNVINAIKEKYPELKDEIKADLRKDVSNKRAEWRNIIQQSGDAAEQKIQQYKSRKKN